MRGGTCPENAELHGEEAKVMFEHHLDFRLEMVSADSMHKLLDRDGPVWVADHG